MIDCELYFKKNKKNADNFEIFFFNHGLIDNDSLLVFLSKQSIFIFF